MFIAMFNGWYFFWLLFWAGVTVYLLVTPVAFGLSMIFDHKSLAADCKALKNCKKQHTH